MRPNKTNYSLSRKGSITSQAPDKYSDVSQILNNNSSSNISRRGGGPRDTLMNFEFIVKNLYEKRLDIFSESLIRILEQVESDELINTLKQDSSTSNFIFLRAKEILEEHFQSDRELFIKELMYDLANSKHELQNLREAHKAELDNYQEVVGELNSQIKLNQKTQRKCQDLEDDNRFIETT